MCRSHRHSCQVRWMLGDNEGQKCKYVLLMDDSFVKHVVYVVSDVDVVFLRRKSNLVHVKVALKYALLELVGNIHGLGVVSDRCVHDGDAFGAGVSPAASRRGSGEARDGASLSTGTHVVCPVEAFCKTKRQVSKMIERQIR